ncbi:MAG: ligase-associated DNA damage response DEXH box helicase [Burkholderiaceae bacterium]
MPSHAAADRVASATPEREQGGCIADRWFAQQGWQPFDFQSEVGQAVREGMSGLLHATTGSGKTYAVWLAALDCFAVAPRKQALAPVQPAATSAATLRSKSGSESGSGSTVLAPQRRKRPAPAPPLTVLWITPMRALAADTERALQAPLESLGLPWTIGMRTGDTSSAERARQQRRLPTALITTPESLSLMLTRPDARASLAALRMVVVDEWHELIGNKRGVQLQLALARLRQWNPGLLTWGLSATLGNLDYALEVLVPQGPARLVRGRMAKQLQIDTLLPETIARFPWAGHLGLGMLAQVVRELEASSTALVFTNTRSQAELWFQALLDARPDWAGRIALHHGSLDRAVRDWVERALKNGELKAVVCTSSLDLGVDFLPVERVLQIGSPKGVARLMQRAGRSGHAPGRSSRLTMVPTHSLELVESIAAQDAIAAQQVEPRLSPYQPLDVLVQHLVTVALGGGFEPESLRREVASAFAYRDISDGEWQWALDFVRQGGASLGAYPDYRRVEPDADGVWRVPDARLARRHRMGVGTIVSDASMVLKFWSRGGGGRSLGSVEESFVARLRPGDHLLFGGRQLELVRVHEMTAYVRPASGRKPAVPRWNGGRMPLSSELSRAIVGRLDAAARGHFDGPEMQSVQPLLETQQRWSALPTRSTLLAEALHSREGWHLFLYPFAGRNVHLGLASLLAWRLARAQAGTFSIAVNEYGLELLSATAMDWRACLVPGLFGTEGLLHDVVGSLNAGELARRRFREIARISGLVSTGFPGESRSARQLQASASLFYDVFVKYDPENLLLTQAQQEVLRQELDVDRLDATLRHLQQLALDLHGIERPTPFAFPLMVERFRESLSSEKLADRIARMVTELERAAGGEIVPVEDRSGDRAYAEVAYAAPKAGGRSVKSPARRRGPAARHGF